VSTSAALTFAFPEIHYNNILANNDTNVNLSLIGAGKGTNDVNAKYNWWGTIDTTLISRSIFDFEDDFNLGRVTFVPFFDHAKF
jgi:hypothetical protein